VAPRDYAGALNSEKHSINPKSADALFPPKVIPAARRVTLKVRWVENQLNAGLAAYLLRQIRISYENNRFGQELIELAPVESYSEDGVLLPLPKEVVASDPYSATEWLTRFEKGERLEKPVPSMLRAWQWLIISHNQMRRKPKVKLPKELRHSWTDPTSERVTRRRVAAQETIKTLKQRIEALESALEAALGSGQMKKSSVDKIVTELNLSAPGPDPDCESETEKSSKQDLPSDGDSQDDLCLPAGVMHDGRRWSMAVEGAFEDLAGKKFQAMVLEHANQFALFVDVPSNDVDILYDHDQAKVVSKVQKPEPRGGDAIIAKPSKKASKKVKLSGPVKAKKNSKPKTGEKKAKAKNSDLAGPLFVKGIRRVTTLTDSQAESLREFFKLKDPLAGSEWEGLSKKEKTAHRKAMSIPRWAITAVRQSPTNLEKILKGDLNKGNFCRTPKVQKPTKRKGDKPKARSKSVRKGRSPAKSRSPRRRSSTPTRSRSGRGRRSGRKDVLVEILSALLSRY
jgi:hypothetical protein